MLIHGGFWRRRVTSVQPERGRQVSPSRRTATWYAPECRGSKILGHNTANQCRAGRVHPSPIALIVVSVSPLSGRSGGSVGP